MKKIILTISIAFVITQIIKAQVITAVPCDMLGMSVNVVPNKLQLVFTTQVNI